MGRVMLSFFFIVILLSIVCVFVSLVIEFLHRINVLQLCSSIMGYLGNGALEIDETEPLMKKRMKGVLPGKGLLDREQHSSVCNVASVSALLN